MNAYGFNSEGYADPTAMEAIERVEKSNKKYLPLVYIYSKYSGDVATNSDNARAYCRFAIETGAIPFAPHLLLSQYMKEDSERELAMFMDKVLLDKCDEIWVFGSELSAGMKAEITHATKHRKIIRYFDEKCQETKRL